MKKIMVFCSSQSWGGTEKNTLNLLSGLKEKGYEILLIAGSQQIIKNAEELGLKKSILHKSGGDFDFLYLLKTYLLIKKNKPDIVYMTMVKDYWVAGLCSYLSKVKKRINYLGIERKTKLSFKYKLIYKKFITDVIVNSQKIKDTLLHTTPFLKDEQVKIVYNGVPTHSDDCSGKKDNKNVTVIGAAGRFTEQKGFDLLPDIINSVTGKIENVLFLIAGTGELMESVKEKLQMLKLDSYVKLLGFVEDMDSFYRSIDIFILPSRYEGMATVLNEAMSFGVNVISTNVSGTEELLQNGKLGEIVYDSKLFADTIISFIEKDKFRDKANIKRHIEANYSLNKMIDETEKVFTA